MQTEEHETAPEALARPEAPRHPYLVILGLAGAAVAVPLLDIYGKNPEVFVANRSSTIQIVLFGLLAALAIPALLVAILAVTRRAGSAPGVIAYRSMAALLAIALGLVVSRQVLPDNSVAAVALALLVALGIVYFLRPLESVIAWAALLVPAALVLFFAFSPTSRLVWSEPAEDARDTGAIGNPASVVLVQLDELPLASLMDVDGTINESLFPNFARLAEAGTWYRNALSNSIATTQSVPSILTGRLGDDSAGPTDADHPDNLFTLLSGAYDMHVIEWVTDMCTGCEDYAGRAPARFASMLADMGVVYGHLTLPPVARRSLPSIDNTWNAFLGQAENPNPAPIPVEGFPVPPAGERSAWTGWMQRIINGIEPDGPPTLSYVHPEAPHVPWKINPSGTHYKPPERQSEVDGIEGTGFWDQDPAYPRLGFQRHLYQLGFVDQMLGALFDKLEATGTWGETMIIVLSDHGAVFVPGQHRRWPYEDNRDDLYRIPLIIKYPNGESAGVVDDRTAFALDVLPTIVDVLDIDTDWQFDGMSLLSDFPVDRPHEIIHWCCSSEGASTDLDVLFEQVRRDHEWIPDQSSWTGVASVGPAGDLVGTPSSELDLETNAAMTWTLTEADDLADVDRSSGLVQTLLTGRIRLPTEVTSDDLLFTVNGMVAGTGFVIREGASGGEIRGLLAEELIADGTNDVAVLVPDPGGKGWLTGVATDIAFTYAAPDGHVLNVEPEGNRRIFVDPIKQTSGGWTVTGWAADIGNKVPADHVYLFAGDQLVAVDPPTRATEFLVERYDDEELAEAGFSFEIKTGAVPGDVERLMVVAEFGDRAVSNPVALHE